MPAQLGPMRLSIMIPALNEADTVGTLLADLAPLRPAGAEIILVDGGSSGGLRIAMSARRRHMPSSAWSRAAGTQTARAKPPALWRP